MVLVCQWFLQFQKETSYLIYWLHWGGFQTFGIWPKMWNLTKRLGPPSCSPWALTWTHLGGKTTIGCFSIRDGNISYFRHFHNDRNLSIRVVQWLIGHYHPLNEINILITKTIEQWQKWLKCDPIMYDSFCFPLYACRAYGSHLPLRGHHLAQQNRQVNCTGVASGNSQLLSFCLATEYSILSLVSGFMIALHHPAWISLCGKY